ncbi:aldehyde dehydrogenase family protein [Dasania sp. GY-MA-18]|uniref:Aldehyde dehydrogenase family protein n=1 Tax=Dasania phycosphaerae TaxID=2950436 RepID=A0A9J6RLC1_9GAMM|nr:MULTISPECIES: aldehyde dehydrogenase family protein [Dasania]MCR8923086.1 aldehyde dehydrogenase family protein [Dasania sp. GY-MA-18]MCZ0865518.1 aldehyde dehydrogenase family protein [Dasania phycosphaerae]MCZ0869243.1 aldehyde dehydrogenase family protein [Dasania phycosphaerae]
MQMYINGQWQDAHDGDQIEVINPATEAVLDTVPNACSVDVDKAVASSKLAFQQWRKTVVPSRSLLLHGMARKLEQHKEQLAQQLTLEQGKTLFESHCEIEWSVECIDYYAELIKNGIGRVLPPIHESAFNFVLKEPYGVTACITPFNYPLLLLFWKIAPALAAGNTVIIKPSEKTPLTTLMLADRVFDDFPSGVINIITGLGEKMGDALTCHPDVPTIAFTGSSRTGTRIAQKTAGMVKNLHLELGGKDAAVVAPDADIALAARAFGSSSIWNAGQICTSTERIYVPQQHYPLFIEQLLAVYQSINIGPGDNPNSQMGPLCDEQGLKKIDLHVQDAISKGAKVLCGGERSKHLQQGYFYPPTLITNANHSMLCMSEESFGPIVAVMPYQSFEQAIDYVNDSIYGLGACLMSNDAQLIRQFFQNVKAGTIWINDPLPDNVAGPFGGMKQSGTSARELGPEGLESFLETKHVHWEFDPQQRQENWFGGE